VAATKILPELKLPKGTLKNKKKKSRKKLTEVDSGESPEKERGWVR